MKYKNLVFLGTSHIAKQSLEEVANSIKDEKPDIIALELDKKRIGALMSKEARRISLKSIKQVGLKGFIFSLIGAWAEKKLGKIAGVAPGSEMKQAINIAKRENIRIALIDQDIEITLQRLSKAITRKEKLNFLIDVLKAVFSGKKEAEFDLTKVPDKKVIKKLTGRLREQYPNVYGVLIEERNVVIAENIKRLMDADPDKKILVILGAGHIDDVLTHIKEEKASKISYSFSAT